MGDGRHTSAHKFSDQPLMTFINQATNHKGSALLFLLVAVTIMGLLATVAGSTWKTITQRAKEEELLWRGNQYRKAIGAYYTSSHGGTQAIFPQTLEQLIRDPRMVGTVRYLRKLYLDPITGEGWELIKDSTGRIQGIHSSSQREPFKKENFAEENKEFAGKTTYADWRFIYQPKQSKSARLSEKKTEPSSTKASIGKDN